MSWWERLTEGETGSCSDGRDHAQQIFNPTFWWRVKLFSFLVIYLGPNYGGGNEDNGDLLQRSHACTATLSAPNPASGHHQPMPLIETPGHSQPSLAQSVLGSLLLSPGSWCTQRFCLWSPRVCLPVLCKFWQLCRRVNDDLPKEGLCHTQVCCTQSPCPCGSPLLTRISTGDAQTQFCLSLCVVSGSWCKICLSPLSVSCGNGVWF